MQPPSPGQFLLSNVCHLEVLVHCNHTHATFGSRVKQQLFRSSHACLFQAVMSARDSLCVCVCGGESHTQTHIKWFFKKNSLHMWKLCNVVVDFEPPGVAWSWKFSSHSGTKCSNREFIPCTCKRNLFPWSIKVLSVIFLGATLAEDSFWILKS